jgi:formate hydrogenlyase subunit 4
MNGLLAALEPLLFILISPLLAGWIKWIKCRLQNRRPPSLLQPYRDLVKLFRKTPVVASHASWLFETTPYILFTSKLLAVAIIPSIAVHLPTASIADVIALVGFLALGRFDLGLGFLRLHLLEAFFDLPASDT